MDETASVLCSLAGHVIRNVGTFRFSQTVTSETVYNLSFNKLLSFIKTY
jgi:hypothetical protein